MARLRPGRTRPDAARWPRPGKLPRRAARAFLNGEPTRARAWFALRGLFDDSRIARLIDPDLAEAGRRQFDTFSYLHGLSRGPSDTASAVSLLELQAYMHNQLLRDTDVMSMAHGVEVRCPLIDHELVEFVAALPPEWKFGGRPKALLLRALEGLIPPVIVNRPKAGFTLPFGRWLRGDLSTTIRESLDETDGIIDSAGARALWQDFQRGRVH